MTIGQTTDRTIYKLNADNCLYYGSFFCFAHLEITYSLYVPKTPLFINGRNRIAQKHVYSAV